VVGNFLQFVLILKEIVVIKKAVLYLSVFKERENSHKIASEFND
jgi:hypothetical protein